MPLKRSNTLGVISFGGEKLRKMVAPHPEKQGFLTIDKPRSQAARETIAKKVSKLVGLRFKKIKWFWRSSGSDHKMLYLTCPHKNVIYVSIEVSIDASNPLARRKFAVGSQCIECKKAQKLLELKKGKFKNQSGTKTPQSTPVKATEYTYPSSVNQVKEKAPSAIPGGFLHLRNKFHETFMAIYTADSVPTVQSSIVNQCFEEDMAEINQRTMSMCQTVEKNSKTFDFALVLNHMEENVLSDNDMPIDLTTSEISLEMESYPEEFKFSDH